MADEAQSMNKSHGDLNNLDGIRKSQSKMPLNFVVAALNRLFSTKYRIIRCDEGIKNLELVSVVKIAINLYIK